MTVHHPPYRVERFSVSRVGEASRVSATIDGREVWFESSGFKTPEGGGSAFLAVALLAAMAEGRDIDLSELPPASPTLLASIPTIQDIWTQWNPHLTTIEVHTNQADNAESYQQSTGEGLFFSGGIDATHSALEGTPGQHLVFVSGFDQPIDRASQPATTERLKRLASRLGAPLTMVETNWIEWRRERRLSASLAHGGCLVAIAHLLGLGRMRISSSNTYQRLTPWGTHALVDPLWSTERTKIEHWGNQFTRAEKIARVARFPELHDDLWVCHENPIGNCGRCAKCARTRVAFYLLGSDLPVKRVIAGEDPVTAYLPHLKRGSEHVYIEEMKEIARTGGHEHALRLLERGELQLTRRHLLRDLRNAIFSHSAQRRMATTDLQPWGYGPAPRSL